MQRTVREARRHPRGFVPLRATVFRHDAKSSKYLVRNLSAGGAQLLHGPPLEAGARVHVLLEGAIEEQLIKATVVRCDAILEGFVAVAVHFQGLAPEHEDFIQHMVLDELERQRQPAVLLALQRPELFAALSEQIQTCSRRVALAVTALDAVRCLCDLDGCIEAVIVERSGERGFDRELLSFLMAEFPAVRRVLVCAEREREALEALQHGQAHALLVPPWTPAEFAAAVEAQEAALSSSVAPA